MKLVLCMILKTMLHLDQVSLKLDVDGSHRCQILCVCPRKWSSLAYMRWKWMHWSLFCQRVPRLTIAWINPVIWIPDNPVHVLLTSRMQLAAEWERQKCRPQQLWNLLWTKVCTEPLVQGYFRMLCTLCRHVQYFSYTNHHLLWEAKDFRNHTFLRLLAV
jgi:hypothetical protein